MTPSPMLQKIKTVHNSAHDWGIGRVQMDELRERLDELRDMVVRLVERDTNGEKQADKLEARIEKLEAQVGALNLETGKLTVKMSIVVAVAVAAFEILPRLLDKFQ